jgi:hypothetical protein
MKSTIISAAVVFAFFAFYKLYQFIDPFGRSIGLDLNIRRTRGDLKDSVKAPVALFMFGSLIPSVLLWEKLFYVIASKNMYSPPGQDLFFLPAFLMGFLTTWISVDFLSKVFLRKHYLDICDFLKLYGGFSSARCRLQLNVVYISSCLAVIIILAFIMKS